MVILNSATLEVLPRLLHAKNSLLEGISFGILI